MITEICGFVDDKGVFYKTKEDYEKTLLSNQYAIELELLVQEVLRKGLLHPTSEYWIHVTLQNIIRSDIDINKLNELRTMHEKSKQ